MRKAGEFRIVSVAEAYPVAKARPVKADGIAALQDTAGDVFLTTEGKVECFDVYGRSRGQVAVPKGTGTNLCLGPNISDKTIYFTTWDALYSVKVR